MNRSGKRAASLLALAVLIATPAYYVNWYIRASRSVGIPSYDIYAYAYPMMLQAVAAVRDGGRGVLWNAWQNCGQPFLGSGTTGLLYPGNLLFFVLDPDWALYALLGFNFMVGSLSAYFLCRELGTGRPAAVCGGLAFGLGASSVDVNTSTPIISGPFMWLPGAMAFCERILRAPSATAAVGLAATIGISLIPGHPQFVLYLYQLIALRVLWELVTRPRALTARALAAIGAGVVLGPLLAGVQLLPVLEVTRESIRGRSLALEELTAGRFLTWKVLRNQFAWRWDNGQPFLVLPAVMAAAAVLRPQAWRVAAFYAGVAAVVLDLAMGPNGLLFPLYLRVPFVGWFRDPARMLVLHSFGIAVLAGIGVQAILAPPPRPRWQRMLGVGGCLLAGLSAMYYLAPNRLNPYEWRLGGTVIVAGVLAALSPRLRPLLGVIIVTALVLHLVVYRMPPFRALLPDGRVLFDKRPVFALLQQRMTPHDRVYLVPRQGDHSLQQKTGSLFGIPSIFDYSSQTSQRYADFFAALRLGRVARNFNEWSYPVSGFLPKTLNRRLLNLAAGRYLVVPNKVDQTAAVMQPPVALVAEFPDAEVRVYENSEALPRAAWLPRVEVVADRPALLSRLANGNDDLRQVALLETAPASGFLGTDAPAADARVEFIHNDPERVALRVTAPARGFVFLADQHFPGWHATVNGAATAILRANYVFRLVEAPPGESVVEWRYAPASLRLGALVSALAGLVALGLLIRSRRAAARGGRARNVRQ